MPSPVGHSLAGMAIGVTDIWPRRRWLGVVIVVALSNLPDIDFLLGYLIGQPSSLHWGFTHSISVAIAVGLLAGWLLPGKFGRTAAICTAAYASHLVLDMLIGPSPNPDVGLKLLAPFSSQRFMLPWSVFPSYPNSLIHENPLAALFSRGVLPLVAREVVVLGPAAIIAWVWATQRRPSGR